MKQGRMFTLLALGVAQGKYSMGWCPEVENMKDFDHTKYVGQWYEQERDYWNAFTIFGDCVTKEFKLT